jgi:hypothetical protein
MKASGGIKQWKSYHFELYADRLVRVSEDE